jgi:hypothetical protein
MRLQQLPHLCIADDQAAAATAAAAAWMLPCLPTSKANQVLQGRPTAASESCM